MGVPYASLMAPMVLGEGEHDENTKKAMAEKIAAKIPDAVDALYATYKEKKAELDEAAFKLLDVNNDGGMPLSQFLKTVQAETQTQKDFYNALGFGEEAVIAKITTLVQSE